MTEKPYTLPQFAVGTGAIAGNPEDKSLVRDVEGQAEIVKAAINAFHARGMCPWIDTALHYGAGNALIAIGLALGEPADIHDLTLSVKVGRILKPLPEGAKPEMVFQGEGPYYREFDYSAEGVRKAFEQSFEFLNKGRREKGWRDIQPQELNTVVFIHDPETGVHGKDTAAILEQVKKEALPAL